MKKAWFVLPAIVAIGWLVAIGYLVGARHQERKASAAYDEMVERFHVRAGEYLDSWKRLVSLLDEHTDKPYGEGYRAALLDFARHGKMACVLEEGATEGKIIDWKGMNVYGVSRKSIISLDGAGQVQISDSNFTTRNSYYGATAIDLRPE